MTSLCAGQHQDPSQPGRIPDQHSGDVMGGGESPSECFVTLHTVPVLVYLSFSAMSSGVYLVLMMIKCQETWSSDQLIRAWQVHEGCG